MKSPNKEKSEKPFWKTKTLVEMSQKEWESLCDGCGKCCLIKLEDAETKELFYTDVACHLLDENTCQCKDYKHRRKLVDDCLQLEVDDVEEFKWLPKSCSYRRLHEGRGLPKWHYLISGDRSTVHKKKKSVKNRVISETEVMEVAEHIVYWV
ncbi:MAG: YcgN family cysteine cluster protein [Gammaproteobacteria bacterium]|nr:MAG: YcgN family cysteine cluster protein [Gammaproteobacteria bacterium]